MNEDEYVFKKLGWPDDLAILSSNRFIKKSGGGKFKVIWVDFRENTICLAPDPWLDEEDEDLVWLVTGQELFELFDKIQ